LNPILVTEEPPPLSTFMSDNLATYLNDHLAGARLAVDMLERLRDTSSDATFHASSDELLAQIESDRAVLQDLIDRVSSKSVIKEATAWFAEKASRAKLRLGSENQLAVLQTLETLSLGVLGKQKLWQSLHRVSNSDERLVGPNYQELIERAKAQHDQIEQQRLAAAEAALRQERT
jgi:predicted DNA binding CopG/RHH family protein